MVNIDYLSRKYFSKGKPCPYKLKSGIEILIYPILVENYEEYEDYKPIIEMDKNKIGIAEIITMSQLEYLNYTFNTSEIGMQQLQMFKGIFELCLKEDYVAITINNGKYVVVVADKTIKDNGEDDYTLKYTISNKEYLDIVKIILYQNDSEYDDAYIDSDVLKEYNEMMLLKTKGLRQPSLEERKIFVLARYKCSIEDINNMTKRFFDMLYYEYIGIEQYFIDTMYKTSEKFEIKESILYPLFKPKEDKFKDLFITTDTLNSKLGN